MIDNAAGDLLYGFKAIAAHIGIAERQAIHRVRMGQIPTFKMGRAVCARRSTLITWLAEQETRCDRTTAN